MSTINRKQFLHGLLAAGVATGLPPTQAADTPARHPRAISMWDFSWLERRWPGAGYEDWDQALDELKDRGYDAVRIDAYPHLLAVDAGKSWLLKPVWTTQDWGSPAPNRVQVAPALFQFIEKCAARGIKVGLSTWFRQDEADMRLRVSTPEKLGEIWNATLAAIQSQGLLDSILYVDLCNEWPLQVWQTFVKPPLDMDQWAQPRSLHWMRTAIASVRAHFPQLPLLFSTDMNKVELLATSGVEFFDAFEHHMWMTGENDDEFYKQVGYHYECFSEVGYHNVQRKAAALYASNPTHWQKLLTDKITLLADVAQRAGRPLMTTECWAIVDYKDWPLMPWDWVKELCELGVRTASGTGQWAAIATSNFCGPQFRGMWRDVAWHQKLTSLIKSGSLNPTATQGRLFTRL